MNQSKNIKILVESPCIRHCCLDQDDVCLGCYRSLDEIKAWGNSDLQAKQSILDNAEQRKNRGQPLYQLVE